MSIVDTISESVKFAGFGRRWIMKKQIELIKNQLSSNEKLLAVGVNSKKMNEQLYVTDKRIFTNRAEGVMSNSIKSIPIEKISSVELVSNIFNSDIKVTTSNESIEVKNIPLHIANEIKVVIENLTINQA